MIDALLPYVAPGAASTPRRPINQDGDAPVQDVLVINIPDANSRSLEAAYEELPKNASGATNIQIKPIGTDTEEWNDKDTELFEDLVRQKSSIKGRLPESLLNQLNQLQQKRRRTLYPISGEQIIFNHREREAKRKLRAIIEEYIELF